MTFYDRRLFQYSGQHCQAEISVLERRFVLPRVLLVIIIIVAVVVVVIIVALVFIFCYLCCLAAVPANAGGIITIISVAIIIMRYNQNQRPAILVGLVGLNQGPTMSCALEGMVHFTIYNPELPMHLLLIETSDYPFQHNQCEF